MPPCWKYTCCSSVTSYKLTCKRLCVELHTSRNARSANNFGIRVFVFPHIHPVCVRIKYTSNMASCCHRGLMYLMYINHLLRRFNCSSHINFCFAGSTIIVSATLFRRENDYLDSVTTECSTLWGGWQYIHFKLDIP